MNGKPILGQDGDAFKVAGQECGHGVRLILANIAGADHLSAPSFAEIDRPF